MIETLASQPVLFLVVAVIVALLVGSFLNVVIYRLPVMMQRDWRSQCKELLAEAAPPLPEGRFDLVMPRSRCQSCGTQITALQNLPVLSYLLLRGKCGHCKAPISARYPAIEALTAVLTGLVAWRFGFGAEALMAILLTWTLVAIAFIDFDHQLIPDSLSLPLLWLGLALSLFHPLTGAEVLFVSPQTALIGAMAGYLSLWSVYHLFRLATGKEGMGYGDFKLLAVLGAWLGWQDLPLIIILSAVVGALVGISLIVLRGRDRNVPMPFGPFLAAAGWLAMMFGPQIRSWWLSTVT
ncbi:MAG: prepilin peptidase [Woeseia sp.]|nr:A24 family peptidase [Woeseia sp.]MBT8096058.1 A24 family peptidase [Woeseia sp.]NNE61494.1 prepilin peptidase [Woeseia sp.]NNL54477.1 prepilin peptidase [Woeseia sp.]